jgi:hypothetical protein
MWIIALGITATLFGNGLTAVFIYFCWRVTREEREGRDPYKLPFWFWFAAIVPLGVPLAVLVSIGPL